MSIVALAKVTLYGPAAEKDDVLDGLQGLGCVHVANLSNGAEATPEARSTLYPDARQALQYLLDSPALMHAAPSDDKPDAKIDVAALVKEVLAVRDRARALVEEEAQLKKWIADVGPWGSFELPAWARAGDLRFWFYVVPQHQMARVEKIEVPWSVVSRDHRYAYVVVIAPDEPASMPVPVVPLEPRSVAKMRHRLQAVEAELDDLAYRRVGLTRQREILRRKLDAEDDRAARASAAHKTLDRHQLFALQGWAPKERVPALRRFAVERQLALTTASPGPDDTPPTLLHNPPGLSGGEDLVEFYTTPAYRLWDPSKAVFFSFAVFFAMIFSDAGYSLLLGVYLAFMWKRMGRQAVGRRLRDVMLMLVIASIVYGVLIGTYFGVHPRPGSLLAKLNVLDAGNQGLMMWIAIGVGVAHLTWSNLVAVWWRRHSLTALASLGWAAICLGGFALALGKSHPSVPRLAALPPIGALLLIAGAILVLLFTSTRPFRQLFRRLLDGLKGVTELTRLFGDALSYLRLFALGLASIKLAEVFNSLAGHSLRSKGLGILLGLFVLLIGHAINFALGILNGVVHGLRLNLIEFFNWSVPAEGQRFLAFRKKASEP